MKFKFFINNQVAFECPINSARCIAHNRNGTRCKRRVCIGTPYCFTHLTTYLHLKIKVSTIPHAGKGLFALDNTKGNNDVVFKKGDVICEYGGEFINAHTLNERYGDYTAPYGMQVRANPALYQDCACKRDIGSLANSALLKRNNNAEFYISTQPIRQVKLRAIKNIKNNQEILIDYGDEYLMHEPNTHHTTK